MKIPYPIKTVNISLIALLMLLVAGCGSSGSGTVDPRVYLYDQLQTLYLWAEYVDPDADPGHYPDDEALLAALKYAPKDRFSFIMDKEAICRRLRKPMWVTGCEDSITRTISSSSIIL